MNPRSIIKHYQDLFDWVNLSVNIKTDNKHTINFCRQPGTNSYFLTLKCYENENLFKINKSQTKYSLEETIKFVDELTRQERLTVIKRKLS